MRKRIIMILLSAAVMLHVMTGTPQARGAESASKRLVMYITDWAFSKDITPDDAARITHVRYAFGLIKNGKVDISQLGQLARLKRSIAAYPDISFILSVGGWGAGGFSEAVATEESREALAESGIAAVKALGVAGLDWDWEYPTSTMAGISASPSDSKNMTKFLVLMREKLDALERETGKRYEQSIAVGAGDARVRDYIWKEALPALDTVSIMTYDMTWGNRAMHHANLYASANAQYSAHQAVNAYLGAGVPKSKLLIGAAYYFYRYNGAVDGLGGAFTKRGETAGYGQYAARLGTEFTRVWDERACAAVYTNGSVVLSGDDPESLKRKGQYVLDEDLAGVIVWEYSHDSTHVLTKALADGLGL